MPPATASGASPAASATTGSAAASMTGAATGTSTGSSTGTAAGTATGGAPGAAAAAAPWEGPAPDAVAWLLVNWHNKHPLARRIGVQDVHTVGAVALPFLAQPLPKEPSLEAAPAPGGSEGAADAPAAKPKRRWPWQRKPANTAGPRRAWSDVFIPGLKPDAVAAMALDHGFTSAPDELPLRRVEINNSELESGGATQSGAWPMELVLLSAAIDAGPARTRVLVGRRDQVLGQRALDPKRLGIVAGVAVLLLALLTWLLWPHAPKESADAASSAATAASAASASAAASAAAAASAPVSGTVAAPAASAASGAASEAESGESAAVPAEAASGAGGAAGGTGAVGAAAGTATEGAASANAANNAAPGATAASGAAAQASAAAAVASGATAASGVVPLPLPKARSNGGRPSLQSGVERLKEEEAQKAAGKTSPSAQPSAAAPGATPGTGTTAAPGTAPGTPPGKSGSPKEAAGKEGATTSQGSGAAAKSGATRPKDEAEQRLAVDDAGLSKLITPGPAGTKLVALVALPQKTKPEAEAQLARMQEMVGETLRGGSQKLNGAVFQTKEGWRAAVWPFSSREEAQLINATLLARGLRARAVDF